MHRQDFYFVYVNCNCLAEFFLRQTAAEILASLESSEPQESVTVSAEELDEKLRTDAERWESSPLREINYDFFGTQQATETAPEMPALLADNSATDHSPLPWHQEDEGSDELNLEAYLQKAYSYEAELQERIDRHLRRVDLNALGSSLAQLPPQLPALTQHLSTTAMEQWLQMYRDDDPVLSDLVVRIRQLDMPPMKA
jgi:hypothetical protein